MTSSHVGHLFNHTIMPDNVSTLFAEALESFVPISGQPVDSHLAELREVLYKILLVIMYDK